MGNICNIRLQRKSIHYSRRLDIAEKKTSIMDAQPDNLNELAMKSAEEELKVRTWVGTHTNNMLT